VTHVHQDDWIDAVDDPDAQVALLDYAPAGWPDGTRVIARRVRYDADQLSADPRSRRSRTVGKDQLALVLDGIADTAYAYSFIATKRVGHTRLTDGPLPADSGLRLAARCQAPSDVGSIFMEYRHLGRSGMLISEIAYGNWLTHGSQVEEDAALACVRAALDAGITTFDTADAYAETRAESVLGRALKGERREGLEIFTKVYWPTGPGKNDRGLSRKHIMESIDNSLVRLQTDYVDLYQAHRFDKFTPLEETIEAFADVVHAGKAHYIGVSEWTAEQIRRAHVLARELSVPLVSSQPQYSMLWRVIEEEVVPASEELGIGQIVWSPIAQGVLTGKYLPGQQPPKGSRATDDKGGSGTISWFMRDDVLERVQQLRPLADEAGLSLAQLAVAWVLQNPNVSAAIIGASRPEQVGENAKAAGVKLDADLLARIDEILAPVAVTDPLKVYESTPSQRP
jgi:aryl-alcohol dehydrogenase-like predicted oxidoreductase